MCKLCTKDRQIITDYKGKHQKPLKIVKDYLGENCCMLCLNRLSQIPTDTDEYIIKKLYRNGTTNRERCVERDKQYYLDNTEQVKASKVKYYNEHKKQVQKTNKQYYLDNIEIIRKKANDKYQLKIKGK